jgi:hypothetical protein
VHRLKCWAENFDAIVAGLKTCEVRHEDDRVFRSGELIELTRTDRKGEPTSPLSRLVVIVTHVDRRAGGLELIGRDEFDGAISPVPVAVISFRPSAPQGDDTPAIAR